MTAFTGVHADWSGILGRSRRFDERGSSLSGFPFADTFEGVITDPQSLHRYLYVHGDPVNGIDPSGEFLISILSGMFVSSKIRGDKTFWDLAAYGKIKYVLTYIATIGAGFAETLLYISIGNEFYRARERATVTGNGGKDITAVLTKTADQLSLWWFALQSEESAAALKAISKPAGWDAGNLLDNVDIQRAVFGVNNWAPRSVTVKDNGGEARVYYAHEVNYFFWGVMNAEAQKKGADVSRESMVRRIYFWRIFADAAYLGAKHDGSKGGRAEWAKAGWDYAMTGNFNPPTAVELPRATPSNVVYAGDNGLFKVQVGDDINIFSPQ